MESTSNASEAHPTADDPPLPPLPSLSTTSSAVPVSNQPAQSSTAEPHEQTTGPAQLPSSIQTPPSDPQTSSNPVSLSTSPSHPSMPAPPQPSSTRASPPASERPTATGQNHDRMQTDDEEEEDDGEEDDDDSSSGSDSGTATPEHSDAATTAPPQQPTPPTDPEAMDVAPDSSGTTIPPLPPSNPLTAIPPSTTIRFSVTASLAMNQAGVLTLVADPSAQFNMDGVEHPSEIRLTIPNSALEPVRTHRQRLQREDSLDSRVLRRNRRGPDGDRQDNQHDDAGSDDSSDDEDDPYWAHFKEDTSAPSATELKAIEDLEPTSPPGALDHDFWEKHAFDNIDDPEHVPGVSGRISWTLTGVHGTPEKPNKATIVKSPSVRIGDYDWNIKFYPRGNDGTEYSSAYVECEPIAGNESSSESVQASQSDNEECSMSGVIFDQTQAGPPPAESSEASTQETQTVEPTVAEPEQESDDEEKPWHVAAQVCCVMYNPQEPRVFAVQKSCHGFNNDNADWGWTRFSGPWDQMHVRKENQRQALLRNDTLAFTVYIRTVKDDTRALWWHPPKDKPTWDCIKMTGLRPFRCLRPESSSGLIAAVSAWLHLKPILSMIKGVGELDGFLHPEKRPKPLIEELRGLLEEDWEASIHNKEITLMPMSLLLETMSISGLKKMDVVAMWEHLRRLLTLESTDANTLEDACTSQPSLFQDILVLKQPDHFKPDQRTGAYQPEPRPGITLPKDHEPTSVQETIDVASLHPEKAFPMWECFGQQPQTTAKHPHVLHIELHRQHFDENDRRWFKLGHKIAIEDQVTFSNESYTLYGIIVHSGSLESQDYYSILRPGGPNTRWVRYTGEHSPKKVVVLTRKQAILAHEGKGQPNLSPGEARDKKKENAPVAYVAMYVRTNNWADVLETALDRKLPVAPRNERPATSTEEVSKSDEVPFPAPVTFYSEPAFGGENELDTFDPWSERVKNLQEDVCCLTLPNTMKIGEVESLCRIALTELRGEEAAKALQLWLVDSCLPTMGSRPVFHELLGFRDHSLHTVRPFYEGARFWIDAGSRDATRALMKKLQVIDLDKAIESAKEKVTKPAEDSEVVVETAPEAVEVVAPPEVEAPAPAESTAPRTNDNLDILMLDAQVHENEVQPPPAPPAGESNSTSAAASPAPETTQLCFLKFFDWETQTLRSLASFQVPLKAKVVEEVTKVLKQRKESKGVESDTGAESVNEEAWDIYHQRFQYNTDFDLVQGSTTFESCNQNPEFRQADLQIIIPADGTCFVAQRRPSEEQIATLDAAGKPATISGFVRYLLAQTYEPSYAAQHRTSSYFGTSYFSGEQAYGQPHGLGTMVTMAGDAYTGYFASGEKSSHISRNTGDVSTQSNDLPKGKMIYANHDIYTGQWAHNQPDGQGTMTYAATQNVYSGGWKAGRRHGKGNMQYEVADEEMKLCKVCYEEEMDAMFYACGHVCACEACARQLECCPVCRDKVRAVVKVRMTV